MAIARTLVWTASTLLVLLGIPDPARAGCGDAPGDDDAVAAARAAVEADCGCETAANHGEFVRCAGRVARQSGLSNDCRGQVVSCAARSTCGNAGAVTCCATNSRGQTRCTIEKDADACQAPLGGSACVSAFQSCCDACVDGGCAPPPTRCCLPEGEGGGLVCELVPAEDCADAGGEDHGPGECDDALCGAPVTTTSTSTSTTRTTSTTSTSAVPTTSTSQTATSTSTSHTSTTASSTSTSTSSSSSTSHTTSTASTTSTSTSSSTSTSAPAAIQCCTASSAAGAFATPTRPKKKPKAGVTAAAVVFTCTVESPAACAAAGGSSAGPGTCSPDPCNGASTTTTSSSTSTSSTTPTSSTTSSTTVATTSSTTSSTAVATTSTTTSSSTSTTITGATTTSSTVPASTSTSTSSTLQASTTSTTSSTVPASSTSTTSSTVVTTSTSTTSTTAPPTRLLFSATPGTTSCGGGGLTKHCTNGNAGTDGVGSCAADSDCGIGALAGTCAGGPPPSSPFSGELDGPSGGKIVDLGLGCFYLGGGKNTGVAGTALAGTGTTQFGLTGAGPTFTVGSNAGTSKKDCSLGAGPGHHCVSQTNFGAACTTDANCDSSKPGSCAADANCYFGPPLSLPIGACVLNVFSADPSGTLTTTTGAASITVPLSFRVYLSACPTCNAGVCSNDASVSCTPQTGSGATVDCIPASSAYFTSLALTLPLVTGASADPSSGLSANGLFCPSQTNAGAFGEPFARRILETGSPAGSLTDGAPHAGTLAGTFCVGDAGTLIDQAADLPGPAGVSVPGTFQVQ